MVKTGGKGVMGSDKLVLALLRNIEGKLAVLGSAFV